MKYFKIALLLITIANLGNYTLRGMNMTDEEQNTHSGEKRTRSPQTAAKLALQAKKIRPHPMAAKPNSFSSKNMTARSAGLSGMTHNLEKKQSLASIAEEGEAQRMPSADAKLASEKISLVSMDLPTVLNSFVKTRSLTGHTQTINETIVLRDGRLASCSEDGTIRIWDLSKQPGQREVVKLEVPRIWLEHPVAVNKILELSDGRLASCSSDGTIRIWDLTKQPGQQQIAILTGDELIELRDGRLVSCSVDGTITIWDLKKKPGEEAVHIITYRNDAPTSVIELDDNIIAFCLGETIRVWDLTQRKEIAILKGHKGFVRSIIKLSNNRFASYSMDLTISMDLSIRMWDFTQQPGKEEIVKLEGHTNYIRSIKKLSNNRLASCSKDGIIRVWDLTQRKQIAILKGHTPYYVTSIIELSDNIIASCSSDRTIRIWDLTKQPGKEEIAKLKGHTGSVNGLVKLSGHRLASCSDDGTVRIWNFLKKN